jgi:hypothetical protein
MGHFAHGVVVVRPRLQRILGVTTRRTLESGGYVSSHRRLDYGGGERGEVGRKHFSRDCWGRSGTDTAARAVAAFSVRGSCVARITVVAMLVMSVSMDLNSVPLFAMRR